MRIERVEAITALLRKRGPMTTRDIAEELDATVHAINGAIGKRRKDHPGERFRIVGWTQVTGEWRCLLARYSASGGDDAIKPKRSERELNREAVRRYRAKNLEAYRAKERARAAKRRGTVIAINPWTGLAPVSLRSHMAKVAANTSTLAEAA
jgi:hypothetical protein